MLLLTQLLSAWLWLAPALAYEYTALHPHRHPRLPHPVDLSHPYDDKTLYLPGFRPFSFANTSVAVGESTRIHTEVFQMSEHVGTHMDSPYHFIRTGWTIGDIPFPRFFGKAVYLNLREKAKVNRDYTVSEEDFERWENRHGPMPSGAVVLLDFGWTRKYASAQEYFGTADIKKKHYYHFPGLSERGARWLIGTGKVFGVGTDAAAIDHGQTPEFKHSPVQTLLAQNNLYILKQIAFPLEPLPAARYRLISLPMKILNGTGAPCRVLALP